MAGEALAAWVEKVVVAVMVACHAVAAVVVAAVLQ